MGTIIATLIQWPTRLEYYIQLVGEANPMIQRE